jgi:hypothetical protein
MSNVESIRDSRTRFFHISTPVSLTIPPAIMNPLDIDRANPLSAIDIETREWRASVEQHLTTIQDLLKPAIPATNFGVAID